MRWPFGHSDDINFIVKIPYMRKNMHFQLLFTRSKSYKPEGMLEEFHVSTICIVSATATP
jgi:hypothetical protein